MKFFNAKDKELIRTAVFTIVVCILIVSFTSSSVTETSASSRRLSTTDKRNISWLFFKNTCEFEIGIVSANSAITKILKTMKIMIVTAVSVWKSIDITQIDRAAVHELIDNISEQKGISYAREVRKYLSILFNWAADRGICPFSAMAGMKRADLRYKPRERVLSIEDMKTVWNAADEIGYPFGPIIQLLILTGQRRSEIANIQRSWINSEYTHFEVPASEYKTGVPHVVPLTPKSQVILQNQPLWNGGDFTFSSTNGKTPSSGFSKAKLRIDKACDLEPWTFHDLRRSVATHMARIGIIQEHIERVLGHTIAGVAGTYNRYSYLEEKLSALKKWEKCVLKLALKEARSC